MAIWTKKSNGRTRALAGVLTAAVLVLGLSACTGEGPDTSDPALQPVLPWLKKLATGGPTDRATAVVELGKVPHEVTADALLTTAHKDIKLQVRLAALTALARHGHLAATQVPRLTALLDDRDDGVRRAACETIGWLGLRSADELLLARLRDPSPAVRTSALNALSRLGPESLHKLEGTFATASPELRALIAEAFADAGDPQRVPLLITALAEDDEYLRRTVAAALGRLRDVRALPALRGLVQTPLPPSKIAEFDALLARGPTPADVGRITDSFNRDQVQAGFRGNHDPSRLKLTDPNVQNRYRQLVRSDRARLEQMMRITALSAIRDLGQDAGFDELIALLGDPDQTIAEAARLVLAGLGDTGRKTLARALGDKSLPVASRLRAAKILEPKNDALLSEALQTLLHDADPQLQLTAAVWFAQQKNPLAPPALNTLLTSALVDVRRTALTTMLAYPDPAMAPPALAALPGERDPVARRNLIKLLGVLQAKTASTVLLAIARTPDDPDRNEALYALGAIGDPALADPLLELFQKLPPTADRATAIAHITALGGVKAVAVVPDLLREITEPRERGRLLAALTALGEIGDRRATPVIATLLRKPVRLNKVGVYDEGNIGIVALARLKDPASIDILTFLVKVDDPSGNTNKRAAEALARMDLPGHEDLDALLQLLRDPALPMSLKEAAVAPALLAAGERAVAPLLGVLLTAPAADPKAPFDPGFYAAQILSYIGAPAVAPILKAARTDQPEHVHGRLIEALQLTDDPRVTAALGEYLRAKNPTLRQWAAAALGKSHDATAALALLQAFDVTHEPDAVKQSVAWALAQRQSAPKPSTPAPTE